MSKSSKQIPDGKFFPTDEMVIRGSETLHDLGVVFEENSSEICRDIAESVFISMIEAAPYRQMTQDQDRIDAMERICAGMTTAELRDASFTYQSLVQIVQRREEKKEQPK